MTTEPAKDTLSGEPELILKSGTIRWSGSRHAFEVFYGGEWCDKAHALPNNLSERLDAAYRHLEKPDVHPMPGDE